MKRITKWIDDLLDGIKVEHKNIFVGQTIPK